MDGETKSRVLGMKAHEFVRMHSVLRYDCIVAHAAREYVTEGDRKAFVEAVLRADIVLATEKSRVM